MRIKLLNLLPLLALLSCSENIEYRYKAKPIKLTANNIYNTELIENALFDAEEQDVDALKLASKKEFLKGVDAFKNNHDIASAIKQYKKAILLFPDAKLYYELGNTLLKRGGAYSLNEANDAYRVAEVLGFQPLQLLTYKQGITDYQLHKTGKTEYAYSHLQSALTNLKIVLMNGFIDSVAINKEPLLAGIQSEFGYKYLLLTLKPLDIKNGESNAKFSLYKSLFPYQPDGIKISPEQVEMKSFRESISYDFAKFIPEMESSSFSRDVSADYFYVGKVKETPIYTALLYASVSFSEQDMQPVYTQLVVYDNKSGSVISTKTVACNCSPEKIRVANITANKVEIEDLERIWDKPITSVSFKNNKVLNYTPKGSATYTINELGNIEIETQSKQFNDSLIIVSK